MENNIDIFLTKLEELSQGKYSQQLFVDLRNEIVKSGCIDISFKLLPMAGGMSSGDGRVAITSKQIDFSFLIFIILHELAHQHQYKKYRREIGDNSWLRTMAAIKHSSYQRKYSLPEVKGLVDQYATAKLFDCRELVKMFTNHLKHRKVTTPDEVTAVLNEMLSC